MDIPTICNLDLSRLYISGKGFKSIKYNDGTDCYVRIPEYLCENGIELQTFNNVTKAYLNLTSDKDDSSIFSAINNWLRQVVADNFPHATVHPLGHNGYLRTRVDLQDNALDVVIFDEHKQRADHTILKQNCRVSSICMLTGVWCMNNTASISLRVMQMRVFPPLVESLNTEECLIIDDKEDVVYIPFQGGRNNEKKYNNMA